ncbi:Alpha-galactosidase [Bacillus sp. THAF10]|uniref:alpha-galactosidase n=1 Tax=Bacillus sp. THAF10 TaxID=2587848 RepID=UPI001268B34E|nr:alpha-galactosidase [Bacillus sp. THAF10]QFT89487.1 Alpha-galactosidase [Bacillus sp. THAF10]
MPIFINEDSLQFHLQGKDFSYLFHVMENDQLEHLYYGKKVTHRNSFSHLVVRPNEDIGNATFPFEGNGRYSLEAIKQEYPTYGSSDFREPALQLWYENGSRISDFRFKSFNVQKGKPGINGLPSSYVENDMDATTLTIILEDSEQPATLELFYTVFEKQNMVTRSSRLTNNGPKHIEINRLLSASVDFPTKDYTMLQLDGAWIRERHLHKRELQHGVQSIDSKRGTSSSQHNPFMALAKRDTNENSGEVYGFSLVYSGNFLAGVEVDHYETARAYLGINSFDFRWQLRKFESFHSPEALLVYSDKGFNGMSQSLHHFLQKHIARGIWRDKERPILINNWEATYFDFDEDKLLSIADVASDVGIELFVLDDGWFLNRNDDTSSLGDWFEDKKKLKSGLRGLAKNINARGMKFGLWFEPEMISKESLLYKKHPEWVLKHKGFKHAHGRNQYILDLTQEEVRCYILDRLRDILSSANIEYVKWDMNRNMTEIGSSFLDSSQQGEVAHRYILGLYTMLEKLTEEFPEVLFESCASGGNRFDPGMLYYMPQAWTSDNTDAIERLNIQYGTSYAYPSSMMGAHVSSVPNHQTGRITSLLTRFHVSMFGAFGYELDATSFTEEEKQEVEQQVAFYKKHRHLLQYGTFFRLKSPFESNDTAWMVVSPDKKKAIVAFYRKMAVPNPSFVSIPLDGLDSDQMYQVQGEYITYLGDELMNIGLQVPPLFTGTGKNNQTQLLGDYQSKVWVLEAVDGRNTE